jgi:NAD(P)H dehydrogenase (quinone)
MHSLIIKSHPRADGFTHSIASSYKSKIEKTGNTATILDLCESTHFQEYAKFGDNKYILEDASTKRMQDLIRTADEIVWVFPVWWMDCPAVMKNFWDRNFTTGFAFRYNADGKVDKLLTGKTTKVFATAGGPWFIIGFFMGLIWKLGRFGFVGLKTTSFRVLGTFPKKTEEEKQKFLQNL